MKTRRSTTTNSATLHVLWVTIEALSALFETAKYYLRVVLVWTWFMIASGISMTLLPFRWKDSSLSHTMAKILAWGALPILGCRTRIEGLDVALASQPCIYTPIHQSNLDMMTLGNLFPPRTVIIGKKQIRWVPLFGLFFVGAGNIMINRKDRKNSIAGLDQAAASVRARQVSVWIFPEGTRNHGAATLLPFKKGPFHLAIMAQVPIVPVVSQRLTTYIDKDKKRTYPKEIRVRVLEPISTIGLTVQDVDSLLLKVRTQMELAMQDPVFGFVD